MGETPLIRTTLLVALIVAFGLAATGRAPAADQGQQVIQVAASDAGSRFVPLGIGKSVVIDLPRDVKDVLVADPKIANAVIRSARRAYIIGVDGRTDQRVLLRPQRPADRRPRHRGDARPQRTARRDPAGAAECRHPRRRPGRGRRAVRQRLEPDRSAHRLRHRLAPGRRRPQGRERHHRSRPRSGHAQGHRRRSAARRHQAARHRPLRHDRRRHVGAELQQRQPVSGLRASRWSRSNNITAPLQLRSTRRCARWSAPASSARWPSRT